MGHVAFHILFLIFFIAAGASALGVGIAIFYVMLALFAWVLLPTGSYWASLRRRQPLSLLAGRPLVPRSRLPLFTALFLVPQLVSFTAFALFPWETGKELSEQLKEGSPSPVVLMVLALYLIVSAPVAEELIFRHYALNRLAALKQIGLVGASLLTTLVFAMGHTGMMEPAWLKWLQISLFGISLAICQIRINTEACILLHLLLNISAAVWVIASGDNQ